MTHHGGEAITWRCFKAFPMPVAYVDGEVACAAVDGKNCLGYCKKGKLKKRIPANIKPLKCGADHKSKYNITGYDNPSHWCAKAKTMLPAPPAAPAAPAVIVTAPAPPAAPATLPVAPAPTVAPTKSICAEPSPAVIPSVYAQKPLEPEIVEPVPEKKHRSPFDYVFYLIELLVSVAAITVALVTTTGNDWTIRLLHLVVAIMFKYVYIGYFLLNNFNLF